MKKILVSAYALSPVRGSECAVGWEITKRLGEYFDVTVMMCAKTPSGNNFAEEVENYLNEFGPIKNISFVYVPMPKSSKFYTRLHDIGFWPAFYWGYNCWQKSAFKVAQKLHDTNKFSLAYQLNMIGFREPGYLWKLPIPFVWGPINGFHSIPFSFLKSFKGKDYIFQILKHLANNFQSKNASRPKIAAKKASLIWCVDMITKNKINHWNTKTDYLQETGLKTVNSSNSDESKKRFDGIRPLKLIWSGMITPGKALRILIDALLINKDFNFELTVLGDGPLMDEMKIKAQSINHKIAWKGWLSKEDATNQVELADLLIHTSLKEGTTNVILEAIGCGVPVVCHDTCGMGIVVNGKNGFKIPYKDFDTSIFFISELIKSIFKDPQILNNKFDTISQTTDMLSWDNKVTYIAHKINTVILENEADKLS